MSSVYVNNEITEQLCLVRHFILVDYREQHKSCVQIHVHLLTRGITSEMYIMVYVDKNTLHKSSIYHRHIEHFFHIFGGSTVFSLISESTRRL